MRDVPLTRCTRGADGADAPLTRMRGGAVVRMNYARPRWIGYTAGGAGARGRAEPTRPPALRCSVGSRWPGACVSGESLRDCRRLPWLRAVGVRVHDRGSSRRERRRDRCGVETLSYFLRSSSLPAWMTSLASLIASTPGTTPRLSSRMSAQVSRRPSNALGDRETRRHDRRVGQPVGDDPARC